MKRILTLACLLVALTAQAQEDKGAQRLHKAIVEFIDKYKKSPLAEDAIVNLDAAGGLLPQGKNHAVKTSKSCAWFGTQYRQTWAFQMTIGTDAPHNPFPLKELQKAFDKESGRCASCYNCFPADSADRPIFPGLQVTWGSKGDMVYTVRFGLRDNVRVISFVDADGFRSTYLLTWNLTPIGSTADVYVLMGAVAWFYCSPAPAQVVPWLGEKNVADGGNGLSTDTAIVVSGQEVQLNNLNIGYGRHTAYRTLLAKVMRMRQMLINSSADKQTAIVYTLHKVCSEYTPLLSPWQYEELSSRIGDMRNVLSFDDDKLLADAANKILKQKVNRTPDMASLRDEDQEYLNAHGFHLLRHDVCHDHVTYDGQYYTGDEIVKYLDTYDSEGEQKYHAEKVETGLQPGVYRLTVATRASGTGAFIYMLGDNGEKHLAEIPVYYTEGGNIWADARRRVHELEEQGRIGEVSGYDRRLANANNGRGFGWNRVVIGDVVVKDDMVRYGVTTLPEFTGKPFRGTWFSACDFELERMGDLPQ